MRSFRLWLTVPTPAIESALFEKLIHQGYVVSALSSSKKTTHWENSLCSIIALKIDKDIAPQGDLRAPSIVIGEVEDIFKQLGAILLTIVVAEGADAAWDIGEIPKEIKQKVKEVEQETAVSPLLTEEPFG